MHEQNWEAVIMYGETVFEPEVEAIKRIIIAGSRIFTEIPIFLNTTKKTENLDENFFRLLNIVTLTCFQRELK